MIDKVRIKELLDKIRIDTYYYDEDNDIIVRDFTDVMSDLAASWDVLNDDYKDELYEAMGIMPNKTKLNLNYPEGVRGTIKNPNNITNSMKITYAKDTGIEYLQNQPSYENEVSKYE